jgi:two-component system, LytTR family, sensor histidine kinase AgrC
LKYPLILKFFLLILGGIFLLSALELYFYEDFYIHITNKRMYVYIAIIAVIFLLWVLSIYYFYKFTTLINQEKIVQKTEHLQLEESKKLIEMLRSQRHDFKKQLQVIRVLAQMNNHTEIIKYIQDCSQALDLSNSILHQIANPIISAMFLIFATGAKEQGITFQVDCDLDFSHFDLPPSKITRILGNIIQNAIEIFAGTDATDRSIQVTIWETINFYHFVIWNNGPFIPDNIKEQIFCSGFSTKKSSGLGLTIVKELINELNGKVTVNSNLQLGTEFKVSVPKTTQVEPAEHIEISEAQYK